MIFYLTVQIYEKKMKEVVQNLSSFLLYKSFEKEWCVTANG